MTDRKQGVDLVEKAERLLSREPRYWACWFFQPIQNQELAALVPALCRELRAAREVIEAGKALEAASENWATSLAFGDDLSPQADKAHRLYKRALAAYEALGGPDD